MRYNHQTYDIYTQDEWDTTTRPMTSTSKMNDIQPPVLWHLHPTHMRYNHKTYDISPMTIISIEAEVPQSVSSLNKDPTRSLVPHLKVPSHESFEPAWLALPQRQVVWSSVTPQRRLHQRTAQEGLDRERCSRERACYLFCVFFYTLLITHSKYLDNIYNAE